MRLLAVTHHPTGRRLHVLSVRTHHGTWGSLAIVLGAVWCWRDWPDRAEWFKLKRELER